LDSLLHLRVDPDDPIALQLLTFGYPVSTFSVSLSDPFHFLSSLVRFPVRLWR
jgi:hypothetical protein